MTEQIALNGLQICDRVTLAAASAIAHDGAFWMSGLEFDERSSFFRLSFHLPDEKQTQYQRIVWPISRRVIPFAGWQLTFQCVQTCRVEIENELNKDSMRFEIASIQLNEGGNKLVIATHFVVTIELSISALSGEIVELPGTAEIAPLCSLAFRAS